MPAVVLFVTIVPLSLLGQENRAQTPDLIGRPLPEVISRSPLAGGYPLNGFPEMTSLPIPRKVILADPPDSQRGIGSLILWGGLGSVVGIAAGGALGAHVEYKGWLDVDSGENRGLTGFLLGAAVGSSLLSPPAVHLANNRRGSLLLDLLATALATAIPAILASHAEGGAEVGWAFSVPIFQVGAAVWTESRTGR